MAEKQQVAASPGADVHEVAHRLAAEHDVAELTQVSITDLQEQGEAQSLPLPTKNPPILPLNALEPEVFERLIAEMVTLHDSPTVHFYGRRGQRQYGLDIYEEQADGTRVLYQVKRYAEISCPRIRSAITDYAGPPKRRSDLRSARRFNPHRFIVVTSACIDDDTAKVELIAQLKHEYRGDLQIAVWGAEAVSHRLRESVGLVTAMFGASWAEEFCGASNVRQARKDAENRHRIEQTLRAAIAAQFAKDNEIRFRQVELTGITVESLFVDVPVTSHPGKNTDALLRHINPQQPLKQHSNPYRSPSTGSDAFVPGQVPAQAGAAQALLHPDWSESAIIVGGPGQGKTTLLQFLCQFYRARVLGREEYSPIAAGLAPVSAVRRTPIKVELTDYAEWRRERSRAQPKQRSKVSGQTPGNQEARNGKAALSLESYITKVVADASAQPFTIKDLAFAVTSRPILLALDGLDEVADLNEREQVADEIRATNSRLKANNRDIQVLVATRPGSIGRPIWRDPQFAPLFLQQLTPGLRMKYLERWTQQSKLEPSEIRELRKTFTKSIILPHVVDLAGNPMQLAILLHLMQRRTVLPEKRTTLYDRYIDVFMDREAKVPIVAKHKDLIVAFHKLLAWHIHARVELGESRGTITLDELKVLLTNYLVPRGRDAHFIDELFKSVTTRVLCLVQRDLDSHEFQFEVQPLREYFAAEHIFDMSPNDTLKNNRPYCLSMLLRRPYWSNVMRFFAGKFASGEVPAMIYVLRAMQQDSQIGVHPISRVAAKLLLDDQVLASQPELVLKDMVRVILDPPGPVLAMDGLIQQDDSLLRFRELGGAKQAVEVLIDYILSTRDFHHLEPAAVLLDHFGALKQAARAWWKVIGTNTPTQWLRAASALHALEDLTMQQLDDVAKLVDGLDPDTSLLEMLIRSQSNAIYDQFVTRCIQEMRHGHIDLTNQMSSECSYARLASSSSSESFYGHLGSTSPTLTSDHEPEVKSHSQGEARRKRLRSGSTLWNSHVQALESAHAQGGDWTTQEAWDRLFDTTANIWSEDCWPIREAILALPSWAYPSGPDAPSAARGASWRAVGLWSAQAFENRGDLAWWRGESKRCVDNLASMTYLATALTTAYGSTVQALIGHLNSRVANLDRRNWAVVSGALRRYSLYQPGARVLSLGEPLRLRQINPNGRLAVLIWHIGTDSTKTQLCHFLTKDLEHLWNAGPSVSLVLQQFLKIHKQTLKIPSFHGSRLDVPEGTLRSSKILKVTYPQAQEILRDPRQWPTDIVRAAADHLGTRLSKQPPVSKVASENNWGV